MSQKDARAHPSASSALLAGPGNTEVQINACWSASGVYGDGSCPELRKFVHCRNCPVYSAASVRAIDRPLPANYREEWSQHFAQAKRIPEAGNASAILFQIHGEWLALPTQSFQEIAEKRPIHSLPNRREGIVLGLANVRGELVTCISIGHLLQMDGMPCLETIRTEYKRLLVLHWEGSKLAFPVDEVNGPHRLHTQQLKAAAGTLARANARYAQAAVQWQNGAIGLLDPDLLMSDFNGGLA